SSRRRHTISKRDWSSDVCSSDLFHAFGFNTLHNALNSRGAEVVAALFHYQAVDAHHGVFFRALGAHLLENVISNAIFTGAVGRYNGAMNVVGHVFVVGQQLFGVFGQAVAAVAKAGVVVVVADAWV